MSGKHLRDEISARADGEDPGIPDEEIEAHIATCESCRRFAESTEKLRDRLAMVREIDPPDMSRTLISSIGRHERRRHSVLIRWLLAGCALIMIAVAIPDFVSTTEGAHTLRHISAFRVAYAVGLLGVVARPARARTMFYISVVLVVALVSTSLVDLIRNDLDPLPESLHLVQVVAAVLLWIISRPRSDGIDTSAEGPPPDGVDPPGSRPPTPGLHLVSDDRGTERTGRGRARSGTRTRTPKGRGV